ncbi:hypothetical protein ACQ4M3_24765 [Leptolyngbya sp. AN03gr2]
MRNHQAIAEIIRRSTTKGAISVHHQAITFRNCQSSNVALIMI